MPRWIFATTIALLCLIGNSGVSSAADCPVGSTTTISGALSHFPMENEGAWLLVEPEKMTPCSVGALRGRGKAPAGCEPGKRFTASGYVTQALFLEMHITSMRCF